MSRALRTPGLPPTHGSVGYRWQNTGSCSLINTRATSCRTSPIGVGRGRMAAVARGFNPVACGGDMQSASRHAVEPYCGSCDGGLPNEEVRSRNGRRAIGAQIVCQGASRFWGLGSPKIFHERRRHPDMLVLLVLAAGVSRIYLQVHYPTDVLAGLFLGIAWILGLKQLLKGMFPQRGGRASGRP